MPLISQKLFRKKWRKKPEMNKLIISLPLIQLKFIGYRPSKWVDSVTKTILLAYVKFAAKPNETK